MYSTLISRRALLYFWFPIVFLLGLAIGYLFNSTFCSRSINKRVGSELNLYFTLRKLWADHVFYTRNYVLDAATDHPATQVVAKRLLKNQEEIGDALGQFYGGAVAKAVADLLKEHILIAVDIVTAARLNDTEHFKELDSKWHKNADDIAKALSDLNPAWSYKTMQRMLYDHLSILTHQVSAHLKKDWQGDINAFDKGFNQILDMAVELAQGLIMQFPARF